MNKNQGLQASQIKNPSLAHIPPDKHEVANELISAIGGSNDVLARATTVFPFSMNPDTVTLDRTKLTITHRDFFKTAEVLSIRVEDILNVTAGVDAFFGSIKISTRFFDPNKPYVIKFLKRKDALKLKRIVQGYLIARQQDIDCSALSTEELAKLLDELGKVPAPEKV